MGWTDREPYFSMIQNRMDDGASFDEAYESMVDSMRERADQMRKGEE
jgi:hypothetical protein